MTDLPDPSHSRAILVGVAEYRSLSTLPAAGNNLSALAEALLSDMIWGLPTEHCVVVRDPRSAADMLDPVMAAQDATDTLLFYYAGHGLVDPRRSELHLATIGSDPQRMYTAVPYSQVRDALLESRASRRVVILDCCYSGRALGQMADPITAIVDEASAEGTYVLAAAAENKVALAPPGAQYTVFTAELLNIINNGVPGLGPLLDLDSIYRHLLASLRGRGFPAPQKRDRNTAGQLMLIRNQAFLNPRPTLVIVDGDYIVAALRGRTYFTAEKPTDGTFGSILNEIFASLAKLGQIRLYATRSVEHETLLKAAAQARVEVTVVESPTTGKAPNIDLVMATDVMAELSRIGELILVTGDSDFVPLVERVKRADIRVTVGFLPATISRALAAAADHVVDLLALNPAGLLLPQEGAENRAELSSGAPTPSDALRRLEELPGLDEVKRQLETLRWRLIADVELRAQGRAKVLVPLHLVFVGNPGTGKTTVARLVAQMYKELGVLRRGHVIEVGAADLVAGYVGDTVDKMSKVANQARDGVLFIDEAYQLGDQRAGFGREAIDTLLARMESDRDRLVVIFAGNPAKMEQFLENTGLQSRFPPANFFVFKDYEPDVLAAVLLDRLRSLGLLWTSGLETQLKRVVEGMYRTRRAGFGNGRAMRELADEIRSNWAGRTRGHVDEPADIGDVPDRLRVFLDQEVPDLAALLGELDGMVGLQPVKDAVHRLVSQLNLQQRRGRGVTAAPHMLFLGPPGTGKTTVARLMGRILRSLGLLARGHLVEVGRAKLVASYIGQTALKTNESIQEALDGVLFIDEAYSLSRGVNNRDFGSEAIDTLYRQMENLSGRLVVIAAGHPEPMDEFLSNNPGLASRFGIRMEFPAYSSTDLLEMLRAMAISEEYILTAAAEQKALAWLDAARSAQPDSFGNARAVRGLLAEMEANLGARTATEDANVTELSTFRAADVPNGKVEGIQ